jgi:methylmalonyl-CoA/ethylmalonyl-CoA epimerase
MVVDHIGIVVRSLDTAIKSWLKTFGYSQMTQPVVNTRQKVRVVFLSKEGSTLVKLIEPVDSTSPVSALSAKGGGLHHLCFKADNLEETMSRLEAEGARVIVPPEPGEAFENNPIAFVYVNGLPVEIIATDEKAQRIASGEQNKG